MIKLSNVNQFSDLVIQLRFDFKGQGQNMIHKSQCLFDRKI